MSVSEMNVGQIRRSHVFMRAISIVVLITFASVTISPGAQAIAQTVENANTASNVAAQQLAAEKNDLGKALGKAKQQLRVIADLPDVSNAKPTATERAAKKEELKAWREELRRLDAEVRAEFDSVGAMIAEKKLPEVIKARHAEALAKYQTEMSALNVDLDAALNSTDGAVVKAKAEAAYKRLNATQLGRSQQDFDPNNLPNSSLKPDRTRVPKMSAEEFQSSLLLADPTIRLAQMSGFDFSQLPGASDPNYLAATTEVVLTEDIKAKAEELNRNPVEIYNWVRNNVHWQPTWGAIQDASHTLSAQRGNAFDIASLTIALLRAAGIPSRYVHGTIDVPEAKFRNWAGGFQYINAAIDFASAGGIPITAVTSGGQITKVRMEHIWVEAAVDFKPSRGAKNRVADTWVAMDPSFKQIEVLPGLDAAQISGIDPEKLAQSVLASGTINEGEGWVTGFDAGIIQSTQARARVSLENHLSNLSQDTTVGDVVGGRKIILQNASLLPASMANQVSASGARYSKVPASLQQKVSFELNVGIAKDPISPQSFPWARLNSRKITLSFRPQTQVDTDVLNALLPETEVTDYLQIPTSIPAYLVRVVPELKIGSEVLMSGAAIGLGEEVSFFFNTELVGSGTKRFTYRFPAGSYLAVAVVSGTIPQKQFDQVRADLARGSNAIDPTSSSSEVVTRDSILGDMYHGGILAYYGQYHANADALSKVSNGNFSLAAGIGTFGYEPKVDTFFGVPRAVRPGSNVFNVPIVNVVGHSTGDLAVSRYLTMQMGMMSSALEHAIPEEIDPNSRAVSTARAFESKVAEGGRIIGVDQHNLYSALSQSQLGSDAQAEVVAAIRAGRVAITHSGTIAVPGWIGAGYLILDPATGSGAYKISGGMNGGVEKVTDAILITSAGASGYLDGRLDTYAGRDIWHSERLKTLASRANLAKGINYAALALGVFYIATDKTLSSADKFLRICVEMLFFGITNYITGALASAIFAGGSLALPLVVGVAFAAFTAVVMAYALLTIQLIYYTRAIRSRIESAWT